MLVTSDFSLAVTFVEVVDALTRLLVAGAAALLVFALRRPMRDLLSRKGSKVSAFGVTIEVGDRDVPLQNAIDEVRRDLDDLQVKVADLLVPSAGSLEPSGLVPKGAALGPVMATPTRLLWVDDTPENNTYLIAKLRDRSVAVRLARSTQEALLAFAREGPFSAVITDMGRPEGGDFNQRAGLELVERLRSDHPDLPVIVYTTASQRRIWQTRLLEAGARMVTASPVELLAALNLASPGS